MWLTDGDYKPEGYKEDQGSIVTYFGWVRVK